MRKVWAVLALLMMAGGVHGGESDVKKGKDGVWYSETLQGKYGWFYEVDTIAQLCFVGGSEIGSPLSPIPCANLAKRPEWKSIITWVEAK